MAAARKPDLPAFLACLQRCMEQATTLDSTAEASQGRRAGRTGFIGVTKHKRTQRYEGHVWLDKKQVYLGAYDIPAQAACGHDVMALRARGRPEDLNFPASLYAELQPMLQHLPQSEVVIALRTFSKSLNSRPAGSGIGGGSRASSIQGGSGRGGTPTPSPSIGGGGGSVASLGGRGNGNEAVTSSRAVSAGGGQGRASKRKLLTPTPSLTDLESLERHLMQDAASREQRTLASTATGGGGQGAGDAAVGGRQLRRMPHRGASSVHPGASGGLLVQEDDDDEDDVAMPAGRAAGRPGPGAAGASGRQLRGLPPLSRRPNHGAYATAPPEQKQGPHSPLKIAPLRGPAGLPPATPLPSGSSSSAMHTSPAAGAAPSPLPALATPALLWPQPGPSAFFSPTIPAAAAHPAAPPEQLLRCLPTLQPLPMLSPSMWQQQQQQQQRQQQCHHQQPQFVQHYHQQQQHEQHYHNQQQQQPLQRQQHQQQQQPQQAQQQQPPQHQSATGATPRPGQPALSLPPSLPPLPLLPPAVASRAARELASIEAALRLLTGATTLGALQPQR